MVAEINERYCYPEGAGDECIEQFPVMPIRYNHRHRQNGRMKAREGVELVRFQSIDQPPDDIQREIDKELS